MNYWNKYFWAHWARAREFIMLGFVPGVCADLIYLRLTSKASEFGLELLEQLEGPVLRAIEV